MFKTLLYNYAKSIDVLPVEWCGAGSTMLYFMLSIK